VNKKKQSTAQRKYLGISVTDEELEYISSAIVKEGERLRIPPYGRRSRWIRNALLDTAKKEHETT